MDPESPAPENPKPWIKTPCILSGPLSRAAGCNIWLKLDNLQPSGSFKSRGVGNLMLRALERRPPGADVHFYSSSGGNAGLACAAAAAALGRPATVVVPESTGDFMKAKIAGLGARVVQVGSTWAEADRHLRDEVLAGAGAEHGVYVPPFDHPDVWAGNATLVEEVGEQLAGVDVHAVACCVGGGGLLNGVLQGLDDFPLRGPQPAVLALETSGADSLNASVREGRHVTLPGITSIATSLGAVRVCDRTWEYARTARNLVSLVVSDGEAARAAARFADDARMLVEASCGATVSVAYGGRLRKVLGGRGMSDDEWRERNVVLVVCGGSNVSLDVLEGYRARYGAEEEANGHAVNGDGGEGEVHGKTRTRWRS